MLRHIFILLIIVIVAFAGVVAASRFVLNRTSFVKPAQALTPISLVLDWTPNTNHTGIYVAKAKGWYKEQGIDLKILPYSSSASPDILVSMGKADVGIGSAESVVANRALGQDVISVAAIIAHNTSSLAVLEDSEIASPKDLDGKTYGGFGAPSEEAVVNAVIKKGGGVGEVKNIVLQTAGMEALIAKRVDVIWIYDGWEGIQARNDGVQLRTFPLIDFGIPDYYTPVLISSNETISAKKDILQKFMAATQKGYEYAAKQPKESARLLIVNTPKGMFPDEELVFESQEYLSKYYVATGKRWGEQEAKAWHEYPEFLISSKAILDKDGKTVEKMDFSSLYTNDLFEKNEK